MSHLAASDAAAFAVAAAEVRGFASALPPPLPERCAPFLDGLLAGSFARVAALLPLWLCDLAPLPAQLAARLGLAQLFGWWHAAARDALIDGQATPEAALTGGLALMRALAIYGELGLPALPCWHLLEPLEARAAAAYAAELAGRPVAGQIAAAHVAPWLASWQPGRAGRPGEASTPGAPAPAAARGQPGDAARLASSPTAPRDPSPAEGGLVSERAASYRLALHAQLDLAAVPPDDLRRTVLPEALGCLIVARQMADDAIDWPDDLRAGRLSSASAALAARMLDTGEDSISLERLAARLACDETFWADWWAAHAGRCAAGAAALAPFGPTRLGALIDAEAGRAVGLAGAGALWRARVRALLGAGGNARV